MVVAPVFVDLSVKTLGAAADRNIHHRARTGAEFGAIVARQGAEFADRVRIDVDEIISASAIVLIVCAIQIPRRGIGASAVDRLPAVVDAVAAKKSEPVSVSRRDAWKQCKQLRKVASVKLEFTRLLSGHGESQFAIGRLYNRGVGLNRD